MHRGLMHHSVHNLMPYATYTPIYKCRPKAIETCFIIPPSCCLRDKSGTDIWQRNQTSQLQISGGVVLELSLPGHVANTSTTKQMCIHRCIYIHIHVLYVYMELIYNLCMYIFLYSLCKYVYIYIYIYIHVCVCIHLFFVKHSTFTVHWWLPMTVT